METTSIGNGSDALVVTTELLQRLTKDLSDGIGASERGAPKPSNNSPSAVGQAAASQGLGNLSRPMELPPGPMPVTDVASVLLAEVATSDITKLSRILEPAADAGNSQILDSLLYRAVQEVAKGNDERAVGYLADYATRAPGRAASLPLQPELEPVRDKIDSMVNRMTQVAKMSAEDGLSRAEQTVSQSEGKVSNWDTNADVLLKMAHRLFEAGGYANYSRTSELARVVNEAATEIKAVPHVLAASASASGTAGIQPGQIIPGINAPYWVSPELSIAGPAVVPRPRSSRRNASTTFEGFFENLQDLREIAAIALSQLWTRAPLLVVMLTWLFMGLWGGVIFSIASHIWPDSPLVTLGNFAFQLWGIGFLGLVGFGFYARIRQRPRR